MKDYKLKLGEVTRLAYTGFQLDLRLFSHMIFL